METVTEVDFPALFVWMWEKRARERLRWRLKFLGKPLGGCWSYVRR